MATSSEKPTPKLEKLNEHFEQFSSTTALHGFGFIVHSKCMEEKLLWLVLTVIASILMIYYCHQQIAEFRDEPTVTEVFVKYEKSISFPSPTMCVTMNVSQFHCSFQCYKLEILQKVIAKWKKQNIHNLFMPSNSTIVDLHQNETLDWLSVMSKYLGAIVKLENTISERNTTNWISFYSEISDSPSLEWLELVGSYVDDLQYNNSKLKHSQLIKIVAHGLCKVWDLQVIHFETHPYNQSNNSLSVCEYDSISWFGQIPFASFPLEVVCSFMEPNAINLTGSQIIRISARPLLLYNNELVVNSEAIKDFRIYMSTSDNKRVVSVEESNDVLLEIPFNDQTIVNVELQANYSAYDSNRRPCAGGEEDGSEHIKTPPPQDARSLCRSKVFVAQCNCWPLSHFALAHSEPECDFHNTSNPNLHSVECFTNITDSYDPGPECSRAEWLNPCILNQFSFGIESLVDTEALVDVSDKITRDLNRKLVQSISNTSQLEAAKNSNEVLTVAYLVCRRFSYPLFREKLKKDTKDLVADIGGTIGGNYTS